MGRVGRAAAPRERGLLRTARTLLRLRHVDDRHRHGRRGGPHLPAWPAARRPLVHAAPDAVARPGGGDGGDLAVVPGFAPFLLLGCARPPLELAPTGALSPPYQPHLLRL